MGDYHYFPGENPVFQTEKKSKLEMDVWVSFKVLGMKWMETEGISCLGNLGR
ncbi:hypothetical protein MKX03_031442 [Papaver bracteatum]|nr:hypothetical protein MKX03_031442 [Papaver bracteatum]